MDYIIGREPGGTGNRLRIISQLTKQEYFINSVTPLPNTISREHCLLSVNPQLGTYSLKNLKPQNTTWVNGVEIASIGIRLDDRIELGPSHYPLDVKSVLGVLSTEVPKTYSITHLKSVWEKYHQEKMQLQIKERRNGAVRSVTGVLSPLAILCALVPIPGISDALRIVLFGGMFFISLYFLISGIKNAKKYPQFYDELDKQFQRDYVCPNPSCQRFLGNVPYDVLVRSTTGCPMPHCKAIYSTK